MSLFDKVTGQQNQLQQIQHNPIGMARQAGYQIPENLAGNPQAMFQHLMQTGQITNPVMQRLMPMLQKMGLK